MKALNIEDIFTKLDAEKPQKGSAYIEKQIFNNAARFMQYLDNGYSEEQIFSAFPLDSLTEIEMDKKTFIRKLKTVLNRYKKTLLVKQAASATPSTPANEPDVITESSPPTIEASTKSKPTIHDDLI